MSVRKVIEERRSLRYFEKFEVKDDLLRELAYYASLAPSCYNNQPWRFIFIKSEEMRRKVFRTFSQGNSWAKEAPLFIAVYSREELDCVVGDRKYYLFDTGLATAFLMLVATELGLIAHAIAGYDEKEAKKVLGLDEKDKLICFLVVGKRSEELSKHLSEEKLKHERERPKRKDFDEFAKIV